MQITGKIAQTDLTRQELLRVWMRRNGLTYAALGRELGVGKTTIKNWFQAERIPAWRHEALVQFGVPVELLPEPINIAPGPKRSDK